MSETLETAADNHLDVPNHKRNWPVLGFYCDQLSDRVNFEFIVREMDLRFTRPAEFDVIEQVGRSYVIANLAKPDVVDALEGFADEMENCGCLDEDALSNAVTEAVDQEWEGLCFSYRLMILDHEDIDFGEALKSRPPDGACAYLENCMAENGQL